MKAFVLGGDGFCGWPTALHLSSQGYQVVILDDLSRRKIDIDLEVNSLTPISTVSTRIEVWNSNSENKISFYQINIAKEYTRLVELIKTEKPDIIVHFAEQRSAPYSMKSSATKIYTVDNNINATNNVLCSIVETDMDIHLVHLGTMGVYGYGTAGMKIPEGYLSVKLETDDGQLVDQRILYPTNPGSIYHMTKTQDQLMFAYFNKNNKIRITDLHQGIVWGTNTDQTLLDDRLINRFDYDGDYGTVLNRFLIQAAIKHPLTVHGTGGQTRAFIHIRDTVRCIQLAIENSPNKGEKVKIFNQMTQTHKIRDLANLISAMTGVEINYQKNPRNEDNENDLFVENKCFLELGLKPTTLQEGLLDEITEIARKYAHRIDKSKIVCTSYWTKDNAPDNETNETYVEPQLLYLEK